jgi:hypothetical protein
MSKGAGKAQSEVLQGSLDLMILKTLQALGPLHGFGSLAASSKSATTCSD